MPFSEIKMCLWYKILAQEGNILFRKMALLCCLFYDLSIFFIGLNSKFYGYQSNILYMVFVVWIFVFINCKWPPF